MNERSDFACIKSWLTLPEIAVVHSLLEESGIPYYIENENAFTIEGGGLDVGHAGLTRLMVDSRREEEARQLLGEAVPRD